MEGNQLGKDTQYNAHLTQYCSFPTPLPDGACKRCANEYGTAAHGCSEQYLLEAFVSGSHQYLLLFTYPYNGAPPALTTFF